MAITVRELVTKLGFQTDKKGVDRTQKLISGVKKAVGVLAGALITGKVAQGIANIVRETAALGDTIDKVSQKLGINAQALQELRFAAEQTGVEQRTFDLALQRFTRRAAEAARGTGEAKDALAQMGVQLLNSQGKLRPVESLLGDVAEAMRNTKSDGERLRLAFKLFDSEGAALVNTLKGGRGALEALRAKARETGGILDSKLIKISAKLVSIQGELKLTLQGVRNIIAKELIPRFIEAARGIIMWVKANRQFLQQNIASVLRRVAVFAQRLGTFFADVASAIIDMAQALTPAQQQFAKLALIAAALAILLALPGGAILAIAGAIALIIEDFQAWREGGKSVIGFLIARLDEFRARWPLLDVVINGVIALAETLKAAWDAALRFIADVSVVGFADAVALRFDDIEGVVLAVVQGIKDGFEFAFRSIGSGLATLWAFFLSSSGSTFDTIVQTVSDFAAAARDVIGNAVQFWFEELFGFGSAARSIFETITSAWAAVFVTMADAVRTGMEIISGIISTVVGFVVTIIEGKFQQAFVGVFDNLKALAEIVFGFIGRSVERIGGFLSETASKVASLLGFGDDEEEEERTRTLTIKERIETGKRTAAIVKGGARVLAQAGATGAMPGAPLAATPGGGAMGNIFINRSQATVDLTINAPQGVDADRIIEIADERVREGIEDTMRFSMEDASIASEGAT